MWSAGLSQRQGAHPPASVGVCFAAPTLNKTWSPHKDKKSLLVLHIVLRATASHAHAAL